MQLKEMIERGYMLVEGTTRRLAFVAPLATRVVIGLAFLQTGWGKLHHLRNVIGFFDSLSIPFPAFNAALVAGMETIGGLMLVAGLATRFFAFGLAITMVVALLTADAASFLAAWSGASDLSPTDVTPFTFLLFLLWLVLYGGGALSVDALLRRVLHLGPRPAPTVESSSP
jgi:putative oxidoreductase